MRYPRTHLLFVKDLNIYLTKEEETSHTHVFRFPFEGRIFAGQNINKLKKRRQKDVVWAGRGWEERNGRGWVKKAYEYFFVYWR